MEKDTYFNLLLVSIDNIQGRMDSYGGAKTMPYKKRRAGQDVRLVLYYECAFVHTRHSFD